MPGIQFTWKTAVESYHHGSSSHPRIRSVVDDATQFLDEVSSAVIDIDVHEDLRENDDRKGF